jgi:hypothetical protein
MSNKERIQFKEKFKKNYDKRSRYDFFSDQLKIDPSTVVTVYPFSYLGKKNNLIPLSGISNSITVYCNENGYFVKYKSDRYGFNNPDKEWDQEEIKYILLGDSFLHGACVNPPDDITSVLRNLSGKSALNLGYAGNGPLFQLATLKEYISSNVKTVIWFYFEGNDLYNLKIELEDDLLRDYLDKTNFSQNLKKKQKQIDILGKQILNHFLLKKIEVGSEKRTRLFKVLKLRRLRKAIKGTSLPSPKVTDDFTNVLKVAKKTTLENNSKLYFVYLPELNRYLTEYDNNNYHKIKEIVSSLNIPFIDIHEEVFKKQKNIRDLVPFVTPGTKHYNELGYKKIAETILKYTQD